MARKTLDEMIATGKVSRKHLQLLVDAANAAQAFEDALARLPSRWLHEFYTYEGLCVLEHEGVARSLPGGYWEYTGKDRPPSSKRKPAGEPAKIGRPPLRTREECAELVARWQASGLSRRKFARQEGITPSTFDLWCNRELAALRGKE